MIYNIIIYDIHYIEYILYSERDKYYKNYRKKFFFFFLLNCLNNK